MRAGDIIRVDFGVPQGSEPGFVRPAVVVTADNVLSGQPRTVHVVPVTSNTRRPMPTDVPLDAVDVSRPSVAQVHLCTVVSTTRIVDDGSTADGSVGRLQLSQMRAVLGDLLDL